MLCAFPYQMSLPEILGCKCVSLPGKGFQEWTLCTCLPALGSTKWHC